MRNPSEWTDKLPETPEAEAPDYSMMYIGVQSKTFESLRGYKEGTIFPHPVFKALHEKSGSGWYTFTERVGLGGIFRLTSNGVIPFNPPQGYGPAPYHDAYDILRAVDECRIRKVAS